MQSDNTLILDGLNVSTTVDVIPTAVKQAFEDADEYFPTQIQKFQFFDKYARYNYDLGRRETWIETVTRATDYLKEISDAKLPQEEYDRIHKFILEMKATPSMRLLAMAGPSARRQNIGIYNCSYLPIDSVDSYVEALIISMSGCGVGFSVEKQYVDKLPIVKKQKSRNAEVKEFIVPDSTEGWADAVRLGLNTWFNGEDIMFDFSQVRPAGAPLHVKGGRASGPEPLEEFLGFARRIILGKQGQKLSTVDAHDIMCMVGKAAVSGGVRRTAMISLFDWDDELMRNCKNGDNLIGNDQRWNANNSAVWPDGGLDKQQITQQMLDMAEGQRGEPGIFSRENASRLRPDRRRDATFGTNPCGEINLRPYEFCNLSIAIARADDTEETLKQKVEVATLIGTIQSMATNFPGLRDIWKKNCQEERLLGVDINGQMDSPVAQDPEVMERLKNHAVAINKKYAETLGIPQSASVTCVKPSGNSSQLFNCASGLHARWAPYYVRNVRVNASVPLFRILKDAGVPMNPENGQTKENATSYVIHFPVKSPEGAITRKSRSAIEQCEYWLLSKKHWTEHNPSVTINYQPEELESLIEWIVRNKEYIGGMSFLPTDNQQYDQMPYEEISESEYLEKLAAFPNIDFARLYLYEKEDYTTAAQELACLAGACDIEDYRKLQSSTNSPLTVSI